MAFLLSSLTVSYSQNSTDCPCDSDAVSCYGISVRKKIATKLLEGEQCDTLLSLAEEQLLVKDSMNQVLTQENKNLQSVVLSEQKKTEGYKTEANQWESAYNKQVTTGKIIGWTLGGITFGLGVTVFILLVTQ